MSFNPLDTRSLIRNLLKVEILMSFNTDSFGAVFPSTESRNFNEF